MTDSKILKLGAFQFAVCGDISRNFAALRRGVTLAANRGVRLLVTPECALTGYPPTERADVASLDFGELERCTAELCALAKEHDMYIALGTIRRESGKVYNSIAVLSPNGEIAGYYDKRALWGYDLQHFDESDSAGVFDIDGVSVGFRICFDVCFPELFRELFTTGADLCCVSFSDVSEQDKPDHYARAKAYLLVRADENAITVISANSTSKFQTAPTAVFDGVARVCVAEAPKNEEYLLNYDYTPPQIDFSAQGRISVAKKLTDKLGIA
jgi:predicted amidohydrolase